MAGTGFLRIRETVNTGRTYTTRVDEPAASFNDATEMLHEWLWLTGSQERACKVIMTWMRGEEYAGHSVSVRHYVSGTVGHWFEILYRA